MFDIGAGTLVAAKAGIDQHLADRPAQVAARGVRDRGGKVAAGAFADKHDRQVRCHRRPFEHGQRVVEGGRVRMLRRQPVVGRDDVETGAGADFGADVVMAVEPAKHKAAAMIVEDDGAHGLARHPVVADRDGVSLIGGDDAVAGRNPLGITLMEGAAHRIIDRPLLGDGKFGDFWREPVID
ncbi:hypothetical protein X770_25585 [Mesorhizobium sp. LSJC269B00]|nr:hypothetical protein X770_25585 [Mesorhizobium sp. LSJC269B00]